MAFAIEVETHRGWVRMQSRYKTKECARSWLSFVKKAWHSRRARVITLPAPPESPPSASPEQESHPPEPRTASRNP